MNSNKVNNHKIKIAAAELSFIDELAINIEVECTVWGDLSKPLIVLLGGISASRWALDCQEHQQSGWWNQVVNQQSYLNSGDYCFLTFEYFVFPERIINPPVITTSDQAQILHQIQSKLSLPQFHAVIGSSYGGMVSLAFAAHFPKALVHLVCIAAADYNSVKSQALRGIQRQIIHLGSQQEQLNGEGNLKKSMTKEFTAIARSLAMIGYRGEAELEQRFQSRKPGQALQDVSAYLHHHGENFAEQFSFSRYIQLSQSIDFHCVDVSSIKAKTQLIGISTDQMVPVKMVENLHKSLSLNLATECHVNIIDSHCGHDGFLLEATALNQIFKTFLSENSHDNFKRNSRRASGY